MAKKPLIEKIFEKIKSEPKELQAYVDALTVIRNMGEMDMNAHRLNKELQKYTAEQIFANNPDKDDFFKVYKDTLLFDAKVDFDSYMLYLEIDRPSSERFYQPRRKKLRKAVRMLQRLYDGEINEGFLSMPPRVGKTTLCLMFATWCIGRNSEFANLYCAYSDIITTAFYQGMLEIMTDDYTYNWAKIFPTRKITRTNAKDEIIDVGRNKRYPSITCRSLYGTLNGAVDCNGILISDDLIGGIEEALNPDRLAAAWSKVDNNMIPRAKQGAKMLWVGTRWSESDPAGIRMKMLADQDAFKSRKYEIVTLPALDENDESNFDYEYGVGFSTDYYRQRRASFEHNGDMASWMAQYQNQPIERDEVLFPPDMFRTYNGELPMGEPDRIFMAVDPAFGGGDYVASPICYQYGEVVYVADVVYTNEGKNVSQPIIAEKVSKHGVQAMQIEANKSTESYATEINELLKKKGIRINITTKAAPNTVSKEARIFDKAPDIRDMMVFLENGKRNREYELFMQNVYSFKLTGKNKHDDAPDSLAMAIDMIIRPKKSIRAFSRPF